jgi:hypothetical protein
MRLSEIKVSRDQLLIESLTDGNATHAVNLFYMLDSISNHGETYVSDILSRDDISDIINEVKQLQLKSSAVFDNDSQTMQLINWMLLYLQE